MSLDINTPAGRKNLIEYKKVVQFIRSYGYTVVETKQDCSAKVDFFVVNQNGEVIGICEVKNRSMEYGKLLEFGTWLISYDKIQAGIELSKLLQAPYYGILHLADRSILLWKISDCNGNLLFEFQTMKTVTQACINGGTAERINAYLPIINATILRTADGRVYQDKIFGE